MTFTRHGLFRTLLFSVLILAGGHLFTTPCSAEYLLDTAKSFPMIPEGYGFDDLVTFDLEDLNNDGILDLVGTNSRIGFEGLCMASLGVGDGTFEAPVPTEIVVEQYYRNRCHFVHLNADAFLDAIFEGDTPPDHASFSTYLGNGDGTFSQVASYPQRVFFVIEPADFNGDGRVDLVLGQEESVQLYPGQGDGTFTEGPVSVLSIGAWCLASGDFDEDGDLDLAAGYHVASSVPFVSILINDGSGRFTVQSPGLPWSGNYIQGVGAADMNGDGHLDLLAGEHRDCVAGSLSIGNGDGTFGEFTDIEFDPIERYTAIGDLDGDGDIDIAANTDESGPGQVTVLGNDGSGSFSVADTNLRYGELIRLGDLDGDGVLDAAMIMDSSNDAALLLGRGDGTLRDAETVIGNEELTRMIMEDLDGDGDPDVAACLDYGPDPEGILVFLNQHPGGFGDPVGYAPGVNAENLAAGDLNGDGFKDLLVIDYSESLIVALLNQGDGTFGNPVTYNETYQPKGAALDDLDGDGDVDAAIYHSSSAQLAIRLNDGSGALGEPVHFDATRFATELILLDLDDDGDLDAALDHNADYDDFIMVIKNNGDGSFAPPQTYAVPSVNGIDTCDIDMDGDPDLCAGGNQYIENSEVTVLFNNGNGIFNERYVYDTGDSSGYWCACGDIDFDGMPDLLISGGHNRLIVVPGYGDGTFGSTTEFTTGRSGTFLDLREIDGDLDNDVVIGTWGGVHFINNNAADFTLTGLLVTGPGPGEFNPTLVRVYGVSAGRSYTEWRAYGVDRWGVNVALGELDGTAGPEVLTGAGPGPIFGPHVRGFQQDGPPLPGVSFLAYGTNKWGVNVCSGDLDNDGFDEIVTGAGPGAVFGPHVRGWNWDGAGTPPPISAISYCAYGTPKGGVNVSCGDIDGDGYDEIVTGAGPGAGEGPHVRGWNCDGGGATAISAVSFLAYGTNKYGVNVSCGDIDGDGIDEMVTGAGPGAVFGPHVRAWNWDGTGTVQAIGAVSFFAYDYTQWGANVSCGDLDGDGIDEIITGPGPGESHTPRVRGWNYDGLTLSAISGVDFNAYSATEVTHGVKVGGLRN